MGGPSVRSVFRIADPTMLSRSCEYGLRASLYLASLDHDGYVSIGTISEELGISFPFLTKIFQQLNDAGLLVSQRGPKGGVALTKPPDEVSLYDIVVAIDGDDFFHECVLGLPDCGEAEPCPLHDAWTEERNRVETLFRDATLAELPSVRLTALD
jgi:Rrf2 family protein